MCRHVTYTLLFVAISRRIFKSLVDLEDLEESFESDALLKSIVLGDVPMLRNLPG